MYGNRNKKYSKNYENDENTSSDTDNEICLKQTINNSYKNETVEDLSHKNNNNSDKQSRTNRNKREEIKDKKLTTKRRLYENCAQNCFSEDSNKISPQEDFSSCKSESKSLISNCLNGSESNTEQDKHGMRQLNMLFRINKLELNAHDKVKRTLNFEEKLCKKELEVLANDFSSDSESEYKPSIVQPIGKTNCVNALKYEDPAVSKPKHEVLVAYPFDNSSEFEYKSQATCELSSSSIYSETENESPESPDMKTMKEMKEQNRRLMEESLSCKPENVKRTLTLELRKYR